jgi:hypothetical protein
MIMKILEALALLYPKLSYDKILFIKVMFGSAMTRSSFFSQSDVSENDEYIRDQSSFLAMEGMFKNVINAWASNDPNRIRILEANVASKLSTTSDCYTQLPSTVLNSLQNPANYFKSFEGIDPIQKMNEIMLNAMKKCITEYIIKHPEYDDGNSIVMEREDKSISVALSKISSSNAPQIQKFFSELSIEQLQNLGQAVSNEIKERGTLLHKSETDEMKVAPRAKAK